MALECLSGGEMILGTKINQRSMADLRASLFSDEEQTTKQRRKSYPYSPCKARYGSSALRKSKANSS